jgi:transposase
MVKPRRHDSKSQTLARDHVLNPHPGAVQDPLFANHPFFDPRDLVQLRYEMVRRHQVDGLSISDAARAFGVSRPTFYKAQTALADAGLAGLVPKSRGPRDGHKVSAEVIAFVTRLKADDPRLTTSECLVAIKNRFGIEIHRRSLERGLARKKKAQSPN